MPIAASTDSSARTMWPSARLPSFGSRWPSSIRAFATASGFRSSCATKLANRERRRRSSSSFPTSRSRSTAPPPGTGVPSTSTMRSRPDIGTRSVMRLLNASAWPRTWGQSSRARGCACSSRGIAARPQSSTARSTKLLPNRRSAARLPYVPWSWSSYTMSGSGIASATSSRRLRSRSAAVSAVSSSCRAASLRSRSAASSTLVAWLVASASATCRRVSSRRSTR
jgi:hypothetical protein